MKVIELLGLMQAKLERLRSSYTLSCSEGNIGKMQEIESEISETEKSIAALQKANSHADGEN